MSTQLNYPKVYKRNNKKISDYRFFHLPPVSLTPVVHLELEISPRIFEKIRNGPNGIIWGLGETDPCRKPQVKNLVALSLYTSAALNWDIRRTNSALWVTSKFPGHVSYSMPEKTEQYIEDQAFLRSYDSVPRPPPPHPRPTTHWKSENERGNHADGKGEGRGAKSYDRKKAWSSINHSILSAAS